MSRSSGVGFEPRLLETISYPTDRSALMERAVELNLPSAVQDAIRRLPDEAFRSRDELVEAVEKIS